MVKAAIADSGAGHNVYIEARTVRPLSGSKRGTLKDTVTVFALVIDSDADKDEGWEPPGAGKQPSIVVETSPGNRQFWLLLDKATDAAEAQRLGKLIRAATRTDDDTGNPVQPYRVAGTPNFVNQAKRNRGRIDGTTCLILVGGPLWTSEDIERAFPAQEPKRKNGNRQSAGIDFCLPAGLMKMIRDGVDEPRRSEQFFRAVAQLKQRGWTIDGIVTLLEKYPDGIAHKYVDRLRVEVERCFDKIESDDADRLSAMNADNCVVLDGGKAFVLRFETITRMIKGRTRTHEMPTFLRTSDFKTLYMNQPVQIDEGKSVDLGTWWLKHPSRRQYAGVVF